MRNYPCTFLRSVNSDIMMSHTLFLFVMRFKLEGEKTEFDSFWDSRMVGQGEPSFFSLA